MLYLLNEYEFILYNFYIHLMNGQIYLIFIRLFHFGCHPFYIVDLMTLKPQNF